ncbi:MAG: zinc ABC transporter substrate-binding protein [Firmicutes bacterium]|nr:zinc ABC transporter substrate-binding protein [Bacillota bacterium]
MKKIISLIVVMLMVIGTFAACGQNEAASDAGSSADSDKKLSIVTTIFPVYDWTKNILGDKAKDADLTMLLDSGTDLHSYQPTADDVMKITNCDMFIYIGGESDDWVDDALKDVSNKDMVVINLMEALGDKKKEEETVEGMEPEDEHEHEGEEAEGEEEEGPEYDEHIWLSLKNAVILCGEIEKGLEKIDPDNADTYKANLMAYTEQLNNLESEYAEAAKNAKTKTLLFGDRFPFRYLADDYGLNYYAAFSGCSAESEASFETISFLAKKAVELGLEDILTIDDSDKKIAKTIIDNTKDKANKILNLDSMQSVTEKDVNEGADFIKIMKDNLSVLKEALN